MNVIVAGSREFTDYAFLKERLDHLFSRVNEPVTIINGGAHGADMLGERYAEERGWPVIHKPANWHKHGKRAGYMRNVEMAEIATHCVVFRVNQSKGSTMMIDIAKEKRLVLRVYDMTTRPKPIANSDDVAARIHADLLKADEEANA